MAKNLFNSVKMTRPNTNHFDLTHDVKLSLRFGELVPIMCTECVPGDKFNIGCESLLRFAPLVAPVMHRMHVTMHYFFVPNRLLWKEWDDFIAGKQTAQSLPFADIDADLWTPLCDYLGIPKPPPDTYEMVSALPFLAYQLIYNEYYRDQNLIFDRSDDFPYPGESTPAWLLELKRRSWEHDYFTSALPTAQAGAPVSIPLGDVTLRDDWDERGSDPYFVRPDGNPANGDLVAGIDTDGGYVSDGTSQTAFDPDGSLTVAPTTINDLRSAFKLQEWLEKNMRGGRRLYEVIKAHFGVTPKDARLNRPEYITGVKTPVTVSEIVNTTGTVELPQGNMSGHAIAVTQSQTGHYFCSEHGYIMGIMSVMPETAYSQGIPKHFTKMQDPLQFYWPSFANIGEQPILNKEIYAYQGEEIDNQTFGYIPRYAEYKFENNRVAGDFRDTLDFWHLGRKFATPPALNQTFVECNPDERIFAVEDPAVDKLYCHVLNKVHAIRPMPKYGTPTF